MKRTAAFLLSLLLCLSALPVSVLAASENTAAEGAILVGNEAVSDSLPNKESERWYKFENKTEGDVEVFLENTDNKENVWRVELYDSTAADELKYKMCPGSSYTVSYKALEAETYYLRVTIGSLHDKESYDGLNYTLRVKTLSDVSIAPNENGAYIFTEAGEDMFILNGEMYSKTNDGATIVGVGYDYNRDPYILLVGLTEEDVQYHGSTEGDFSSSLYIKKFDYEGKEYYYQTVSLYNRELKTELYVCNNGERTRDIEDNAYELMNLYHGKAGDSGKDSLLRQLQKDYGPLLIMGMAVGAVLVIAGIVVMINAIREKKRRDRRSTYTYTYSGDSVGTPTKQDIGEMIDMDIANQIINDIGGTDGM